MPLPPTLTAALTAKPPPMPSATASTILQATIQVSVAAAYHRRPACKASTTAMAPAIRIAGMSTGLWGGEEENSTGALNVHERIFSYDQLNRVKSSESATGNAAAFATGYTYDADGNITSLTRNNGLGEQIDLLDYAYEKDAQAVQHHNRLQGVADEANAEQGFTNGSSSYEYDAIGNLIKDSGEGIGNIDWTVYGKVASVNKTDGTTVSYRYDGAGNRRGWPTS